MSLKRLGGDYPVQWNHTTYSLGDDRSGKHDALFFLVGILLACATWRNLNAAIWQESNGNKSIPAVCTLALTAVPPTQPCHGENFNVCMTQRIFHCFPRTENNGCLYTIAATNVPCTATYLLGRVGTVGELISICKGTPRSRPVGEIRRSYCWY